MLVLTRKSQQELIIGDQIRVTVLEVRGGRVKIGVYAPNDIEIRRDERPLPKMHRKTVAMDCSG